MNTAARDLTKVTPASPMSKLGLDLATTSTFQWLEADDQASH